MSIWNLTGNILKHTADEKIHLSTKINLADVNADIEQTVLRCACVIRVSALLSGAGATFVELNGTNAGVLKH